MVDAPPDGDLSEKGAREVVQGMEEGAVDGDGSECGDSVHDFEAEDE